MALGLFVSAIQIAFAFACVREAKRKHRLNNWWVLAAAIFSVFAYLVVLYLPPKENYIKDRKRNISGDSDL